MKHLGKGFFLTGGVVATLVSCGNDGREKPLNIVYIMTDDHTAQMMSCYDGRYMETPNLDRIAADGVRFTNSFVANSLSGPSRACLITGKHSCANRFFDNTTCVFDAEQQTFPKLLQEAGYQTALVGKWHLESLPTGFDFWEVFPGQGDYYNPDIITQKNDTIRRAGYVTDIVTDDAIRWLEEDRDEDKPFCLMIHHKAIHRNWMGNIPDLGLYEDKTFPLPGNFYDDYEGRPAAAAQEMSIVKDMDLIYDLKMYREDKQSRLRGAYESFVGRMDEGQRVAWDEFYAPIIEEFYRTNPTGEELDMWKFTRYMRDYMKTVKSLDDNVGQVLDYLKAHGLLENTLVVYTSDQGFYMGEHGWFDKRFMYEESMHTPLIMRLPKRFRRRGDIDELVQNIDYAPTFLELAGVEVPDDIQGVSLVPLLKGEKPQNWRDALYYHYYEYPAEHSVKRHYGIRTDRYKLIHFYNDIDVWELYDLESDPYEMHNIYGAEGTEELVDSLKLRLFALQEEFDDPVRFGPGHDRDEVRKYVKHLSFPEGCSLEEKVEMAASLVPTPLQLEWQNMECTAFLHFGINTFTGSEWGEGDENPALFNPTDFDADQWMRTLANAGFKMVILTAKHHDGFCLWPTATTEHSVAASPWKDGSGDVVREVSEACARNGLKFGVYLSPWDRNASCYGDSPAYNAFYEAQLTELLTNYGEISEVWLDGACGEGPNGKVQEYDFEAFCETIRRLQPNAVAAIMGDDVRWVGNEGGVGREMEWSATVKTPDSHPNATENDERLGITGPKFPDLGSREMLKNATELFWYPSEVDVSIRPGWFYHEDESPKSLKALADIYFHSVGRNSVLLLNVPPDTRGRIPSADSLRLAEFARYISQTFETDYVKKGERSWTGVSGDFKVYEFSAPSLVNVVMLQENIAHGQRVESFTVEALVNGVWQTVCKGSTIGRKRLLRFPAVEASALRVTLNGTRYVAELSRVGAFYAPPLTE